MTIKERNKLFKEFFENECLGTLTLKGGDYAGDLDANQNFKRIAKALALSQYQVWSVYFNKHVDAVNNSIKRNPLRPERQAEGIKESLKDIINYAGILLSMLEEDKYVDQLEAIMDKVNGKITYHEEARKEMDEQYKEALNENLT